MLVEEKLGGVQRSQKQMDEFREAIRRFKDLGYCGPDLPSVICRRVRVDCI